MQILIRTCITILFVALAACSRSSDEERIRAAIAAAEKAAEARDTSEVMEIVADDFQDTQGLDKTQLQNVLRGYFITHPKIELIVRIGEIKLETATRARVQLDVAVVGTVGTTGNSALMGDSQSLEVDFRKVDGDWRAVRMQRKRSG